MQGYAVSVLTLLFRPTWIFRALTRALCGLGRARLVSLFGEGDAAMGQLLIVTDALFLRPTKRARCSGASAANVPPLG